MGSFKADGREQGPNRRRDKKNAKRRGFPRLEWLEGRTLLSGGGGGNPVWKPTSTNLADVQNGPMANMGSELINVYQTFLNSGGDVSQSAGQVPASSVQGELGPHRGQRAAAGTSTSSRPR